jgi:hypothetical protein
MRRARLLMIVSVMFADSIAVFPFENEGREPDKESLSDDIQEFWIVSTLAPPNASLLNRLLS